MRKPSREQPSSSTIGVSPTDAFEVHRQMVIALFVATLAVSIAMTFGLIRQQLTALMVVAISGGLGGFVSALRRLYSFQRVFPIDFFKGRRKVDLYLTIYSLIPSLVGTIAATTLYVVFASKLIEGDLFPKFHLSALCTRTDAFQNFVANWQPVEPTDYAKAIVWSFIAGFSERFVPDLLGRLAAQSNEVSATLAPVVSSEEEVQREGDEDK